MHVVALAQNTPFLPVASPYPEVLLLSNLSNFTSGGRTRDTDVLTNYITLRLKYAKLGGQENWE
jgi:hypothetical protein